MLYNFRVYAYYYYTPVDSCVSRTRKIGKYEGVRRHDRLMIIFGVTKYVRCCSLFVSSYDVYSDRCRYVRHS